MLYKLVNTALSGKMIISYLRHHFNRLKADNLMQTSKIVKKTQADINTDTGTVNV